MYNDDYIILNGEKFQTGDDVTCEINKNFIKNAKILIILKKHFNNYRYDIPDKYINNDFILYICQNIVEGRDAEQKFNFLYSWVCSYDLVEKNIIILTDHVSNLKKVYIDKLANIVSLAYIIKPKDYNEKDYFIYFN
jgi:hypothetical protein